MSHELQTVGKFRIFAHGISDLTDCKSQPFVLRALVDEKEVGFLLVQPDRHQKSVLRSIEAWSDSNCEPVLKHLSDAAEQISLKKLDSRATAKHTCKPGWYSLRP
jgi:hypothetical protein